MLELFFDPFMWMCYCGAVSALLATADHIVLGRFFLCMALIFQAAHTRADDGEPPLPVLTASLRRQPDEPTPPRPSQAPGGEIDPPSAPPPEDVPPSITLDGPPGVCILNRQFILKADKSHGIRDSMWFVEPSEGIDIFYFNQGMSCVCTPYKAGKYKFHLVASGDTGRLASQFLTVEAREALEQEIDGPAIIPSSRPGAAIHSLNRRDHRPAIRALVARMRGIDPAQAAALAGSFRGVAGRIANTDIRNWQEMDRELKYSVKNSMGPAVVNWGAVLTEADAVLGEERNSDINRLYDVLFQIAAGIDGRGK